MFTNLRRGFGIGFITFSFTFLISYLFQFSLALGISLIIVLVVILIGILFDILGTAVTAATEAPFHAMAADKVKGSREALYLVRNADRVANICNDVIGDIAGTISGALTAGISLDLWRVLPIFPERLFAAAIIAGVAALTVGGKALGKSHAITHANRIVFFAGEILFLTGFIKPRSARKRKLKSRKVRKS